MNRSTGLVTIELVKQANKARIEGKRYAPHIEAAAAKLPRLTAEEINRAWTRIHGAERNAAV